MILHTHSTPSFTLWYPTMSDACRPPYSSVSITPPGCSYAPDNGPGLSASECGHHACYLRACHLCATVQNKKPGNAIEAAVLSISDSLSQGGCAMSHVTAAEWWAHKRAATDAHQLHFDLDETRIGSGAVQYKLKHPVRCWPSL